MVGVVARKPWGGENGNLTSGSLTYHPRVTGRPLSQRDGSKAPGGREGVPDPRPQMSARETAGALTRAANISR